MTSKQTIPTPIRILNKEIQTITQCKKYVYINALILIFFMSGFFQLACSQSAQPREVSIIDVRNKPEPEPNLAAHKPGDVVIYRTFFLGDGYKVRYY